MAKKDEITYEVAEKIGTLSTKEYDKTNWTTKKREHVVETKELRRVSWNGKPAKLELRIWYNAGGVETSGKGITLDDDEIDTLNFMLEGLEA